MDKDHGMEFPNALGTYISKGVRGVKDDCQRFRLEMQMLKEKAEDTRKREAEVEGMANRVKRQLMEELDVVAHRNLDTLMQPSQIAQPSTREREDLEDVLGGGNPGAASFNSSAIRRRNPCAHGQQFSREESVGEKGPQKKLKDHKINTSTSDSSPCTVSSLPSFPSIGCSQRLYKTAFTAAEYCTPVHPLHHQLHLESTLGPDSEVSKGQYHPNSTNTKYSNNSGYESADLPSPNSTAIVLPTPLLNHNLSRSHELGPQCNTRLQVYCNQHVRRSPLSTSTLCHLGDTHQQVGMMIPGGDCAIVVDHPQEDDEEKEVNQNRKMGQKFLISTTHDDQSRQSLNNWMTGASIPPTPPLCPTLKKIAMQVKHM
jgi:hypothetical protein